MERIIRGSEQGIEITVTSTYLPDLLQSFPWRELRESLKVKGFLQVLKPRQWTTININNGIDFAIDGIPERRYTQ